jgi:SAM-dependent methyltransferase
MTTHDPRPCSYSYPDEGDRITLALMRQREFQVEQWEQQELTILDQIDAILARSRRDILLDYGSGLGRLAIRYAASFARVVSYEPDAQRAVRQRERLAALPGDGRIRVVSSLDEAGADYDTVLCSHVLQHVPVEVATDILDEIGRRIRPHGHVLLITTLSSKERDTFVIGRLLETGSVTEDEVSSEIFNVTARSGANGLLPVRFFAFQDLVATLASRRLDLVTAFGFHGNAGIVGPLTTVMPELLKCRDVAVLARRKH